MIKDFILFFYSKINGKGTEFLKSNLYIVLRETNAHTHINYSSLIIEEKICRLFI